MQSCGIFLLALRVSESISVQFKVCVLDLDDFFIFSKNKIAIMIMSGCDAMKSILVKPKTNALK